MNELRDLSKCLTMNDGTHSLEESTLVPEIIQRLKVWVSGCSVLPLAHQPASDWRPRGLLLDKPLHEVFNKHRQLMSEDAVKNLTEFLAKENEHAPTNF